ncbi:Lar family restriction alleviation protein [Pseudomonas putida]|uniref:Lar family restriction alleviation protein n=1 Tax=Pseudomonas putida TaxID=303 RepID=A0ABD7BJ88_PSEPU|nr:Lar family restriction alleviation protein [Pseudomonas putida]QOD00318.1 Lar family restriction alleviation protein [Pseudomonas putida]
MPTENRSSNTEMVSEMLTCPFCGEKPQITKHHREDIYSFMHRCQVLGPISWGFREDQQAHIEKWNARAQPAPQPHPDPIAWMVGTAFWWTKEEAERDAVATGKPIIPFGPMIDTGEVDRLRAALSFYADREHYYFESGNWDTVSGEPLNILWCGEEPDFIEDGSVARAALERKL